MSIWEIRERGLELPAGGGSADIWGASVIMTDEGSVRSTLRVRNDEALGAFAAVVEEHVCLVWLNRLCLVSVLNRLSELHSCRTLRSRRFKHQPLQYDVLPLTLVARSPVHCVFLAPNQSGPWRTVVTLPVNVVG